MSARIDWRAAAAGAGLALLGGFLGGGAVPATVAAVALGGLLAGRLARAAGALQGGVVAAAWIALVTLTASAGVPEDVPGVILFDLLHLAAGAAAGGLGERLPR